MAGTFGDLHEACHLADYDHLATFSKALALQHVAASDAAMKDLDRAPSNGKEVLFTLFALQAKKPY